MHESLNLIFCGTPAFAVPTLEKLVAGGFAVRLVVTQPDRPKGRGQEVQFSPVKQRALQLGLLITQPEKIKNNEESRSELTALRPHAIIVVGYGRLIPQWMTQAAVSDACKDDDIGNAIGQLIHDLAGAAGLAQSQRDHAVEHVEPKPQITQPNSGNQQCWKSLSLPKT